MKNRKIKKRIDLTPIVLTAFLVLFYGCDNFLNEVPTGQMTTDNFNIETESDIEAVVAGPYRSLSNWTSGAGDWGNILPATLEYPTGKATSEAVHPQLWRYENNQVTGDLLNNFNNQWQYWYQSVRDANFAVQKLNDAPDHLPQPVIMRAMGEARTLRAFFYFNLVRYFGDVVMMTGLLDNIELAEQSKTSLKTIYDEVIIPDLEFAVNQSGLADVQSSNGRVTRHTARAILADVYLTVAGYPYQEIETDPSADWTSSGLWSMDTYPVNSQSAIGFLQGAQQQLNALYGQYELGTYDDLRNPGMNNRGEAIFQAQYQAGVTNNGLIQTALPYISQISMFGDENGSFIPTVEYINSYHPDDKRAEERQFFFSYDTISARYNPGEPPAAPFSRSYLYKYYDEVAIKQTGQSGLNWTFYRYADVLLMLTEVNWALSELGVSVSDHDITKGINEVRERAELPAYSADEVDLHAIMSERAYELIFENKMLWDQRRTRRALVDGNGEFSRVESFFGHQPVNFNFSFGAKHLLSPIPGREMSTNSEMVQNYDYLPR
jgi:starch-binding outer membrane protein, SusD/RagB family